MHNAAQLSLLVSDQRRFHTRRPRRVSGKCTCAHLCAHVLKWGVVGHLVGTLPSWGKQKAFANIQIALRRRVRNFRSSNTNSFVTHSEAFPTRLFSNKMCHKFSHLMWAVHTPFCDCTQCFLPSSLCVCRCTRRHNSKVCGLSPLNRRHFEDDVSARYTPPIIRPADSAHPING